MKKIIYNTIQYFKLLGVSIHEFRRFEKKSSKKEKLELLMLLNCHSLEKGMSFKNIKKGYGKKKASELLKNLKEYTELKYSGYVLNETIAVLNKYFEISDIEDAQIKNLKEQYEQLLKEIQTGEQLAAGKVDLRKEFFESWKGQGPEEFFKTRKSIRNYDNKKVKSEDIVNAVSMARYAPSACNRQPAKVYYTQKQEIIDQIDDIVMGNKGFEGEMPNYLVITADTSLFGKSEVYQWYINGGIFVSHIIMALHSIGIGSCVFQWTQKNKREKELRKLFSIGKKETIIAIIGIGYYPEVASCIQAARKPVSDIIMER